MYCVLNLDKNLLFGASSSLTEDFYVQNTDYFQLPHDLAKISVTQFSRSTPRKIDCSCTSKKTEY